MRIKIFLLAFMFFINATQAAFANSAHAITHEHGSEIFHMFRLDSDVGFKNSDHSASWDFSGWIGNDENKLWLKSEGGQTKNKLESAEFWALYSRNISEFWDFQTGLRQDFQPTSTPYFTVGFDGLAPYYFETEIHLFISENGEISSRARLERDILISQKLITQPYFESNFFAESNHEAEVGAGISNGKIGLQTRYEIQKKFAPYFDLSYDQKLGNTASIAKHDKKDRGEFYSSIGIRIIF